MNNGKVIMARSVNYSIPMSKNDAMNYIDINKYFANPPALPVYLSLHDSESGSLLVSKPYSDNLYVGKVLPYVYGEKQYYNLYINTDAPLGNLTVLLLDDIIGINPENLQGNFQVLFIPNISVYMFEEKQYTIKDMLITLILKKPELRFNYEDYYSAYFTGKTVRQYTFDNLHALKQKGEIVDYVTFHF